MMSLLALFLLLSGASSVTPTPTGGIIGKLMLVKAGVPQADASNAVAWIEGLRLPAEARATAHAEMKSEKKRFTPRVLALPRQAAVEFPNVDPIYHNVFSVSGANRFDLGLYRSGASKSKRFEEPGLVRVYCNIHPQMIGFVMVVDSDVTTVTRSDGSFRFEGVPVGPHVVKIWHEEGGQTQAAVHVRHRADTTVSLRVDITDYRPQTHKNKYGKDYPPQSGSDDERY